MAQHACKLRRGRNNLRRFLHWRAGLPERDPRRRWCRCHKGGLLAARVRGVRADIIPGQISPRAWFSRARARWRLRALASPSPAMDLEYALTILESDHASPIVAGMWKRGAARPPACNCYWFRNIERAMAAGFGPCSFQMSSCVLSSRRNVDIAPLGNRGFEPSGPFCGRGGGLCCA